jgi:hypothetical protein
MPDDIITIDEEGRLIASGRVRERLRQRRGPWRVVPSVDNLIVLQRLDGATAQPAGPTNRAMLCGDVTGHAPLIDVINFIASSRWTGVLSIVTGEVAQSIYFKRGDVKAASSNRRQDRLGDIIYRFGGATKEQLDEALRESGGGRKIGKVLVEKGVLNAHRLWQFIRTQIEEIFYSVLFIKDGQFFFYPRSEDEFHTNLTLSTQNLLMEGLRRVDEIAVFREKLPSPGTVVGPNPAPPTTDVQLEEGERKVLSLVDGHRTVDELARESGLGEFETTKILYNLVGSRFVVVVSEADIRDGLGAKDDRLGNVIETFNSIFRKIYGEVSRKGKVGSLRAGLDAFFAGTSGFGELFHNVHIGTDGGLDPDGLLGNLENAAADNKVDYLYQGLNELLFFELFAAGETLDKVEEENLQKVLNDLFRELSTGADT